MLGEGARTADDATRYFNSYSSAIEAIGRTTGDRPLPDRPGISVKLSALHPRFEAVSRARVMRELVPRLIDLARQAKSHDLNFTVDAEEADRLELSLDVIAAAVGDSSLAGWDGFGLAIQAYQKRASDVIGYVDRLARSLERKMMVRLVKGAYWDTEIKRAQERGLDNYPVFTRKAMTDLNYVACAKQLLTLRPRIEAAFPALPPRWSAAALHSPDLQLCAGSPDALARGEFLAVLGELHAAWPTFDSAVFTGRTSPATRAGWRRPWRGRPTGSSPSPPRPARTAPGCCRSPRRWWRSPGASWSRGRRTAGRRRCSRCSRHSSRCTRWTGSSSPRRCRTPRG